jgi:predicted nucleic acid-binding protein
VKVFADTSFICSLYRRQDNSDVASAFVTQLGGEPLLISEAVELEFRASLAVQVFRHDNDKTQGCGEHNAREALASFNANVADGAIQILQCEWPQVFVCATTMTAQTARKFGIQTMDILHIATAYHMNIPHFASFDSRQRQFAQEWKLTPHPALTLSV